MSNDREPDTNATQARLPIAAESANEASESEQSENTLLAPSEASKPDPENATLVGPTPVASRLFPGLPAVPGYEIRREVARGGMGVVYLAHDPKFDRDVAVKIMHAGQDADRFVIESKVTARLPHPGVPPVYALGELGDGRPFLAMKLIAGRTLAEEIRQVQQSDLPRMLGVFEQICHTVGFAHSQQIIHRDLKPANVMVGAFGEVLVMDWGLAKD